MKIEKQRITGYVNTIIKAAGGPNTNGNIMGMPEQTQSTVKFLDESVVHSMWRVTYLLYPQYVLKFAPLQLLFQTLGQVLMGLFLTDTLAFYAKQIPA